MKNKITITDVASAAGVSKTTVSRYLNNRNDLMSEKTRARIEKVIKLLDYRPSELARSLKSKRTHTIGVLISDIYSPFFSAVITGVQEEAAKKGYTVFFMNSENNIDIENNNISELLSRDIEGLIINTSKKDNDYIASLDINKVPIVLCDRYITNHSLDIVTIDNEMMYNVLFDHLVEQGYNRFGLFIEPWEQNSTRQSRRDNFIRIIKKRFGYDATRDVYTIGTDYKTYEDALKSFSVTFGLQDVPVAIGGNTIATFSIYQAIKKSKYDIPKDIGVCGPDDWNWNNDMSWSEIASAPITTLEFDAKELGKKCTEILINKIHNIDKKAEEIKLPVNIKVRNSTIRKD